MSTIDVNGLKQLSGNDEDFVNDILVVQQNRLVKKTENIALIAPGKLFGAIGRNCRDRQRLLLGISQGLFSRRILALLAEVFNCIGVTFRRTQICQ